MSTATSPEATDAVSHRRPVSRPAGEPTLGRFLLDQLYEAGVDRIFGIPGDFILRLCQVIDEDPRIAFKTLSHEPGVGFAASGAARGRRDLAVACVTYGAGALNMVNPVAAAYAEKTPVLVLTGGPSKDERARGILVHHQVKSFESQCRVFREVTAYQAVLDDPATAAEQVRYAIDVCRLYSLPVYLEVPRDMVDVPIRVGPARQLEVTRRPEAVAEAAGEVIAKLSAAERPVLVVGVEVHRFGLAPLVVRLAEALRLPVVSTFMARGTFPDDHPRFAGVYLGPASPPGVREMVESSDALLLLGALLSDTNMGVHLSAIDRRKMMLAVSREVEVGYHRYEGVPLTELVTALLAHDGAAAVVPPPCAFTRRPFMRADDEPSPGPLRVAALVAEINRFFAEHGEMPVVTDTGDCLFATHEIDTQEVVASAYYATMGFGLPAAMGFEAATGRRPLVLVGDGGFQMTGTELVHALRWGLSPLVVVMNNGSWEMLQSFLPTGYNDIPDWRYAETARLWGAATWRPETAAELRTALTEARAADRAALVEVPLARGDISETLYTFTRSVGNTPPPPG
ncbi:MAG TPA: thiamine pyrophosphate-binding protein [Thermoanaerobaculia bacterium]|nr:thiamine pyrophosphate-binding protein [Thermoanaerobaculia bacterium]